MSRHFRAIAVAAAMILCVIISSRADEVDDYVERQLRQLHIPGLSLAVVRNGRIIKARGYGLANVERNLPSTKDTVYEIGSITKQFTATAVMMLVEEGKVSLDDKITKYFPEAPETWHRITVRHLLTHTSGIQNHVAVPDFPNLFQTNLTRDQVIKLFFKLPLEFQPGETWAYDNTGYYLLGLVVEQASGKSFWQFLDERIFRPVGMTSTRNTDAHAIVKNRASGYAWVNDAFENRPVLAPFVAFSAGAILSTVEDMAKWDAALYTERLLKRSSLEQMWTPAKTIDGGLASFDYGYGWFIETYHGHRVVQHSGGTPGFSSVIYRFVDSQLTVIILTNHADRIVDQLAIDIAGIYVPALARPQGSLDPDPQTSRRLNEVVSGLLNGKHDPALFTPAMRTFLSTATGKAFWKWFASHGALGSFTYSDREDAGNTHIFRYRLLLGENAYWFSVTTGEDGRIARISFW
ncbi:MAG: beta-lactamase family protein [Acidobacteria bacterium]|nr:beta-lactamase family protein [Acidobacteriota bacterium]